MIGRRDVLKSGLGALTTAIFTGRVKGANDRITLGHIGIGAMGSSNLGYALMSWAQPEPAVCCDHATSTVCCSTDAKASCCGTTSGAPANCGCQ